MAVSHNRIRTIGIECESLEGDSYGVARITLNLIRELAARPALGASWHCILYFKRTVPAMCAALDPAIFTTRVIGVPSFSLYYYLALPLRLWRDRPDVMYYPNYMLPILHPPRVRSVVMLTEDIYQEMHNPRLPVRYRIAYRVFATGWAAHRAKRIMAISKSSAAALEAHIPAARIIVNPLGVSPPATDAGREPGRYLLWVGQAFERRHLRETLAAFASVAAEHPDLEFRIVGTDKYDPPIIAETVRHLNRALGRQAVSWRQSVNDRELSAAYAGAEALVYVSDTEAFGLPPLEALLHGTPAVVADTPVTREVFGPYAFYAPHTDVTGITDVLRTALCDRRLRSRIIAARSSIGNRYTWSGFADRFLRMAKLLTP